MFASRSLPIRRTGITFALAAAALLTACDDTITAPSAPAPVSTVQVVGPTAALTVGDAQELSVRLRDAQGTLLTGRSVTWSSSDASVATVSAAGRVTALSVGTATIRATSEGRQGTAQVQVQAAAVASIELSESQLTLTRNSTRIVHADVRDANGRPVTNVWLEWVSEDPSVALVTSSGQIRAVASGETRIVARSGAREAFVTVKVPVSIANVQVIPAAQPLTVGAHVQFQVKAFDDRGREIDASQAVWSSSDPAIARVSASGVVTGVSRGSAVIRAAVQYASGSVAVAVRSNNWHYEANLFHPQILVKSDTTSRTEYSLAMKESHLTNARFSYNSVTQAWTFAGEIVHSERSEFQGNVIWRETGREMVTDHGLAADYDIVSGRILMRSARTNRIAFGFTSWQDRASLQGKVGAFPVVIDMPLTR